MKKIAIASLLIVSLGCSSTQDGVDTSKPLGIISLSVGGRVARIEGFRWPTKSAELELQHMASIENMVNLDIHFPSGRRFFTPSRITFLSQKNGRVSRIEFCPLREAVPFPAALDQVQEILRAICTAGDNRASARLEEWKAYPPKWDGFNTVTAGCRVEDGVETFIKIRSVTKKEKWYVAISLYAERLYSE